MTLTQLRAALRLRLRLEDTSDSDNGSITQAEGTSLVNGAMRRLWALMVSHAPNKTLKSTTMTYTANAETTALPTSNPDLRGRPIRSVEAYTSGGTTPQDRWTLAAVTQPELDLVENVGRPGFYALSQAEATIALRPIPTEATTLRIMYVPVPTALSGNSDTPTFLPEEFHDLLVDGAALEYLESVKDAGLQNTIGVAYNRKLSAFLAFIDDMDSSSGFIARRV